MPIIVLSAGEIKLFHPVGEKGKRLVIAIQCDEFYHRGICLEETKKGSEALTTYLGQCLKQSHSIGREEDVFHGEHRGPTEPILKTTGLADAGKSPPFLSQWFLCICWNPGFTYCLGHTRCSEVG